jgi:hypothetical protein
VGGLVGVITRFTRETLIKDRILVPPMTFGFDRSRQFWESVCSERAVL